MQINWLSKYKFKKIAEESLRNALRLHEDSILLYKNSSYPSSFQLSVLSLEEFAKAKWVDYYYYSTITNFTAVMFYSQALNATKWLSTNIKQVKDTAFIGFLYKKLRVL